MAKAHVWPQAQVPQPAGGATTTRLTEAAQASRRAVSAVMGVPSPSTAPVAPGRPRSVPNGIVTITFSLRDVPPFGAPPFWAPPVGAPPFGAPPFWAPPCAAGGPPDSSH